MRPRSAFSDKVMADHRRGTDAQADPRVRRSAADPSVRDRGRRGRGRVAGGVRWRPAVRGSRSGARTGARRPDRRARPGRWGSRGSRATAEPGCRPIADAGAQRPGSVAFAGAEPRADTVAVGFADAQPVAHGDRRADRHGRTDGDRRLGRQPGPGGGSGSGSDDSGSDDSGSGSNSGSSGSSGSGRENCPTTSPQTTPGRARAADRAPTTRGRLGR